MDFVTIFFAVAVAWFSFIFLRIALWVYEFKVFPATFGTTTNVSLNDLSDLSQKLGQDLPSFNIVIPAYDESLVIGGTLRRMAAINFPQTHFNVWVVTYEDEPREPGQASTYDTANEAATEINAAAGRNLVRTLLVPAGYDGRFPGRLESSERFIGKPRGLNYAIRVIHENNERDERILFVGRMARLGSIDTWDAAIDTVANAGNSPTGFLHAVNQYFAPASGDYIGACTLSSQLRRLLKLVAGIDGTNAAQVEATQILSSYIAQEAPRFFLQFKPPTGPSVSDGRGELEVMEDRAFLYDVMCDVENDDAEALAAKSLEIEARLATDRPILSRALDQEQDGVRLYNLVRRINSRWLATYDADADVPIDLLRHLAARILTEPETMGFQGPVSPVANYDDVHPLCKLGGLSMAFWHNTGYPHLFAKEKWAHVLAGTNWCFRMDGLRRDDQLVREADYDECARHFILSFDPGHLTEDLEVAVRMFDEWQVNAQWHPYAEFEQVPATKQAMIVQRRRWTLGTLQTIGYMLRSRLPFMQKVKYGLRPLDIATSGSGPFVTVLLIIFIYRGDLVSNPITIVWSSILTFANLMYVLPFLQTYERFVIALRRSTGIEYLIASGPKLERDIAAQLHDHAFSQNEVQLMGDICALLGRALQNNGSISRYLASRCIDDDPAEENAEALSDVTPTQLRRNDLVRLCDGFAFLTGQAQVACGAETDSSSEMRRRLERLKAELQKAGIEGEWKSRRRAERRQIWRWAFVYLFWQLVPSYQGLKDWLVGSKDKTWVKTPRTRKHNASAPE